MSPPEVGAVGARRFAIAEPLSPTCFLNTAASPMFTTAARSNAARTEPRLDLFHDVCIPRAFPGLRGGVTCPAFDDLHAAGLFNPVDLAREQAAGQVEVAKMREGD